VRLLTLLLCGLILVGCGDEEGASPYIAATIDGIRWSGPASDGVVSYVVEHPGGWIYTMASRPYRKGHQHLVLNLPLVIALGTYPIDGDTADASFLSCPDDVLADCIWWSPVANDAGTLEVTDFDLESGRIAGTFSFEGYPMGDSTGTPRQFTGGAFEIDARGVFVLE
jgi:hypothetical protein